VRHLQDKVCVITGAAGAIGRAAIEVFAREGAIVVGVDRQGEVACDLFIAADLTDEASVAALYARVHSELGRTDVLFNNAGIVSPGDGSVLSTELAAFTEVLQVNLTTIFLCCKHGIPRLLESGGGSVINTSSLTAVAGSAASQIGYTASKGAVLSLTREIAVEFARQGVRANALCPGPVQTPMLRSLFTEAEAERRLSRIPAGRFARAEEVAEAAAFLAADASSYVTGSEFLVDGGITAAYLPPTG
jgi:NAD(P)-dependent dehydrogenase (short-subunit alcohol dehydrogenase family)